MGCLIVMGLMQSADASSPSLARGPRNICVGIVIDLWEPDGMDVIVPGRTFADSVHVCAFAYLPMGISVGALHGASVLTRWLGAFPKTSSFLYFWREYLGSTMYEYECERTRPMNCGHLVCSQPTS